MIQSAVQVNANANVHGMHSASSFSRCSVDRLATRPRSVWWCSTSKHEMRGMRDCVRRDCYARNVRRRVVVVGTLHDADLAPHRVTLVLGDDAVATNE